jgi:hypothetical protein
MLSVIAGRSCGSTPATFFGFGLLLGGLFVAAAVIVYKALRK